MDGELKLDKSILPLNYWNKEILKQIKIFDTQKGIVREIQVTKLQDEEIEINDKKVLTEKYLFPVLIVVFKSNMDPNMGARSPVNSTASCTLIIQ